MNESRRPDPKNDGALVDARDSARNMLRPDSKTITELMTRQIEAASASIDKLRQRLEAEKNVSPRVLVEQMKAETLLMGRSQAIIALSGPATGQSGPTSYEAMIAELERGEG